MTIDGHEVKLGHLGARQGWLILHKLGRMVGESLVDASEDRFASAIAALFKNTEGDELYRLLEELSAQILVDNDRLSLRNYGLTMKCMKELLMHNFADFFSPFQEAMEGLQQPDPE